MKTVEDLKVELQGAKEAHADEERKHMATRREHRHSETDLAMHERN